jgi:hypothetical protein
LDGQGPLCDWRRAKLIGQGPLCDCNGAPCKADLTIRRQIDLLRVGDTLEGELLGDAEDCLCEAIELRLRRVQ